MLRLASALYCAVFVVSLPVRAAEPFHVWAVDPHENIFRDAKPTETSGRLKIRVARNEYEPGQIVIYSGAPLKEISVELSPLHHADGKSTIGSENLAWNFVGYVPIDQNTKLSESVWVRRAPCEIPDPLLEDRTIDLPADTAQPVWLTMFVPKDAPPGLYRGEAVVVAGDARVTMPIELSVDPFTLPEDRHLLVTNWFFSGLIAKAHGVEVWSEPYWTLLERYARNMAAHRQNVALVPWDIIAVARQADGKLTFDYSSFDRFVELFQRAGVGDRIEIAPAGSSPQGWGTEVILTKVQAFDVESQKTIQLEPDEGLGPLLTDLERHLVERGWLDRAMIHISDEPTTYNLDSWRTASRFVHRAAPRLRRIEAIETTEFSGDLEVWVPKICSYDQWRGTFDAHRNDMELWYYICCDPYGNYYPNRFLDYPLSRVRVLHWINFSERLAGFLHWGLSFWKNDPFGVPDADVPPGDTHVLYPGKDGPLNSIRWEIQRDSIEDFEYLWLLTEKTAALKKQLGPAAEGFDPRRRAEELARRVVRSITDCEIDPANIRMAREAIANEILAMDHSPLALVQTEPPEGTALTDGPAVVHVQGVVEPGATVKVDGNPVRVLSDQSFVARGSSDIQIEIERNGERKTITRKFPVRK